MGNVRQLLGVSEEQARAALAALAAVVNADGSVDEPERSLLRSIALALDVELNIERLPAIEPEDLARLLPGGEHRKRLLQAMVLTALVDGTPTADEVEVLDRYAAALDTVDSPYVGSLRAAADHSLNRLRLDFVRRGFVGQQFEKAWHEGGVRGVGLLVQDLAGHRSDPELAWRYKRLGLLPEHSLGRTFWTFMTEHGFPFPGEIGAIGETFARHDLTHVLAGYATDPLGEIEVAAFTAPMTGENGTFGRDPFYYVFMSILVFHTGVQLRPGVPGHTDTLDPARAVRALERGAACTVDLMSDRWDFWAVADQDVDALRGRYGIPAA